MNLPLRDVHPAVAPPWWPPAPGWWWVAAALLAIALGLAWWQRSRARRAAAVCRLFDQAVDAAATPAAQVATMSELLRRAARRVDPTADRLQDEAWLYMSETEDEHQGRILNWIDKGLGRIEGAWNGRTVTT